jgi:ketosteroid isomerase-like protein
MRKILLSMLLLTVASCRTITEPTRAHDVILKEVASAEAAFHQAMLAGDAEAMASLLDDTFIRTFRDGSQQTRAEALEEIRSGRLKFTSLETSDVTIHVYGDAAVVRGTSLRRRAAVPGSQADSAPFRLFYTMTLVRRAGQWKIVALHASHP